jgi:hypothetical protein
MREELNLDYAVLGFKCGIRERLTCGAWECCSKIRYHIAGTPCQSFPRLEPVDTRLRVEELFERGFTIDGATWRKRDGGREEEREREIGEEIEREEGRGGGRVSRRQKQKNREGERQREEKQCNEETEHNHVLIRSAREEESVN